MSRACETAHSLASPHVARGVVGVGAKSEAWREQPAILAGVTRAAAKEAEPRRGCDDDDRAADCERKRTSARRA